MRNSAGSLGDAATPSTDKNSQKSKVYGYFVLPTAFFPTSTSSDFISPVNSRKRFFPGFVFLQSQLWNIFFPPGFFTLRLSTYQNLASKQLLLNAVYVYDFQFKV